MRHCYVCKNQIEINWKDAELLRRFMDNDDYKILKPRYTGACAKHQRKIARAIKRAREMGIVPYTSLVER